MSWARADALVLATIRECRNQCQRPILVGLSGAQGSGKSTMARRLKTQLDAAGLPTVVLALDDFYLTRAERADLARTVHPLLATRGVPGTHDIALLDAVISALLDGAQAVDIPTFDKAIDDRTGLDKVAGPISVILLEGWCIGAEAQPEGRLAAPLNDLEKGEDADGSWRRWVNGRLASDYAALFARIDCLIYLKAPGFEVVLDWREEQEGDLARPAMDRARLARFVAHYERITRAMLDRSKADLVIPLAPDRTPLLEG